MANDTETKTYNLSVTPLWNTRNGNLMGIKITDEIYDALQRVEKGGKLMVRFLPDESRKQDTSPHAYIDYISKESVHAFELTNPNKTTTGARSTTPDTDDSF